MALPQPYYEPYYPPPQPVEYTHHRPPTNTDHRNSGINTLFVAGLPDDVKAREIHNLFRLRPGFDYCQLKYTGRGNQVVAFAIFVNHQSAMAALHAMNGVKFDPQTGHSLNIELARSNSTRVRKPGGGSYVVIDNRNGRKGRRNKPSRDDRNNESDESAATNETDGDESDRETVKSANAVGDDENVEPVVNQLQTEKAANGACSTLFIANLGPNCSETELEQVVSQYSGFKEVRLRARGGMPVAFADFEDVEQATAAIDALQGSSLPSSDRGGMHIEYARSKMRKR